MSDDFFKFGILRQQSGEIDILRQVLTAGEIEELYQAFKKRLAQEAAVNLFPNDEVK